MKNIKQYYKELGHAAYAVAMADGVVTEQERKTVRESVLKRLAAFETEEDSSNMNKAFYVDFEFDSYRNEHPDAASALRSYVSYVHSNFEPGDEKLLKLSVKVLEDVASAFSRQTEKDLVHEIKGELREVSKLI